MTTHADLTEVSDQRIVADWALGEWADRLLEQAGLGVTIVDRHGTVMYYNKWASEHLDRQPGYLGHSVHERHRRKITNPLRLSRDDRDKGKKYEYFFLTRDPQPGTEVTGEFLVSARETADRSGGMAVGFRFNAKGAARFYELTSANSPPATERESKRHLAIVLDGQIMSAPTLNAVITSQGQISGRSVVLSRLDRLVTSASEIGR